jgi:hypothetical protein
MNKRNSQKPNYFVESGTERDEAPRKKERESYTRLESEKEDKYTKRTPSIIRYKVKITKINE